MRLAALFLPFTAAVALGNVSMPSVFGTNMVLQRDRPVPVWGWAAAGEKVTVSFAGQKKETTAAADGKWSLKLDAMPANKDGQALTVTGSNELKFENVLVGEVWLGSGQSNMQWTVDASDKAQEEIAAANFPNIRLFLVPLVSSPVKNDSLTATWTACTPQSAPKFSAVLYFMGRNLHKELDVPIGLIASSWGGSRIEPWTPVEGFEQVPSQRDNARIIRRNTPGYPEYDASLQGYVSQVEAWVKNGKDLIKARQPLPPLPDRPGPLAHGHQQLVGTYNAMIHPLVPFAIRGAVWYQGEANVGEGMVYLDRMKALIQGWRTVWAQPDMPFYQVQLAPFNYSRKDPETDRVTTALAEIWEAQAETVKQVPNTGMAVINDIGNVADIHPRNKQEAGRRLALIALARDYGRKDLVCSGPVYREHTIEGGRVRIKFDHTGSGLATRDGKPLTWFEIAGADGKFVSAAAAIEGNDIVVTSPAVPAAKAVRFAFSQIAEPNLINKEGLPAGAFRTK